MRLSKLPASFPRATLVAVCLSLLPALALAQTDPSAPKAPAKKKAAPKKATKPAATSEKAAQPAAAEKPAAVQPAPESRPAPAPREEPAPPPRPRAARAAPQHPLLGKLEVEGSLGLAIPFESGMNTGFKLNAAGYFGFMPLGPTMLLQLGANLGFTYNGMPSPVDGSFIVVDLLPTARLRVTLNDKLWAMADGGAGLAIARSKVTIPFFGTQTSTDAAFLLKLGGGIGYDMNEQLSLVALPALNFYIKDGSTTEFTFLVGATMRL